VFDFYSWLRSCLDRCLSSILVSFVFFFVYTTASVTNSSAQEVEPSSPSVTETLAYLNEMVSSGFIPRRNKFIPGIFDVDINSGTVSWSRVTEFSKGDNYYQLRVGYLIAPASDLLSVQVNGTAVTLTCKPELPKCWQDWDGFYGVDSDNNRKQLEEHLTSWRRDKKTLYANYNAVDLLTAGSADDSARFSKAMSHLLALVRAAHATSSPNDPFASNSSIPAQTRGETDKRQMLMKEYQGKWQSGTFSYECPWRMHHSDGDQVCQRTCYHNYQLTLGYDLAHVLRSAVVENGHWGAMECNRFARSDNKPATDMPPLTLSSSVESVSENEVVIELEPIGKTTLKMSGNHLEWADAASEQLQLDHHTVDLQGGLIFTRVE
jgi:hypothetical protein